MTWRFRGLVDVCAGLMTLREVNYETLRYMTKAPERLIIDIKRTDKGYKTTLYLTKKDFKEKC